MSLPLHDPDPWPAKVTNNDSQDLKLVLRLIVYEPSYYKTFFSYYWKFPESCILSRRIHHEAAFISPNVATPLFTMCVICLIFYTYHLPYFSYLQSTSFTLPAVYLIFPPSLWSCFGRKTVSFLTQKVFLIPHIFDKSAFFWYQFLFRCSTPELLFLSCLLIQETCSFFQNAIITTQTYLMRPCNGLVAQHTNL